MTAARTEGLGRASLANLVSLVGSAVLTAGLTLLLVRELDREAYGAFAIALALHQVLVLASDAGTTSSASREAAVAAGDPALRRTTIASGLALRAATSLAAGLAVLLLAGPLAELYGTPALAPVLRAMAAALVCCCLFQFGRLLLNGVGRPWAAAGAVVTESVLEVLAVALLVLLAGGAVAAWTGRIVAFGLGALLAVGLLLRATGRLGRPDRAVVRRIARAGVLLGVADAAYVLFVQAGVLLVGALEGPAEAALLEAPLRVLVVAGFLGNAVGLAFAPRVATAAAEQGPALARALRLVAAAQALVVPLWVAVLVPNATWLFGDAYATSGDVLLALTPFLFLAGVAPLLSYVLLYAGAGARRLPPTLVAIAVHAVLVVALLPSAGVAGAAVGLSAGAAVLLVWFLRVTADELGLRGAELARPLAAAAAVTAVAGAAATLGGPLAGASAGVLAAVGGQAALGLVRRDDLLALRGLVRRAG